MDIKNLIIISGPSGAGEDSIINGLKEKMNVEVVTTSTTRSMRDGESQGNPYYFISKEEFKKKINANEMVEWAQHYNDQYYGVTKDELKRVQDASDIGVWKIDYKGVQNAKEIFPDIKAIFVMADSLEILEKRISGRKDVTPEYLAERMKYTKEWLKHTDIYDYEIINREGFLDETIKQVYDIIISETTKS